MVNCPGCFNKVNATKKKNKTRKKFWKKVALDFPSGSMVKNPLANSGDVVGTSVEKIPLRRKRHPTLVFLPEKSNGERNLVGQSSWGHKRIRHNLVTKQQHNNNKKMVLG